MLIAYDWLQWPPTKLFFANTAFLFTFLLSTALALLVIPYSKRRPKGTPTSWGEAMLAAVFVFGVMFVAFGVVPDRFIAHTDADLKWTKQRIIFGPGDILKPKVYGGHFPFTMSYEAIRDIFVTLIHVWYFGLMIFLWSVWQKRGDSKPGTAVATSTFGRPLVKKS